MCPLPGMGSTGGRGEGVHGGKGSTGEVDSGRSVKDPSQVSDFRFGSSRTSCHTPYVGPSPQGTRTVGWGGYDPGSRECVLYDLG